MQAVGDTFDNAGGFQALIDSIHAEVALADLAGIGIPLGNRPGAGGYAGLAADAGLFLDIDDPVFLATTHGAGGTGVDTPGLFTVETREVDEIDFGRRLIGRGNLDHPAVKGARTRVIFGFTMDFTGAATDAVGHILND